MKEAILNGIVRGLILLCILVGVLYIVSLPWTLPYILGEEAAVSPLGYGLAMGSRIGGAGCGLIILFDLLRMMKTLKGDPFVEQNVKALRRMGLFAMGMTVFTVLGAVLSLRVILFAMAGVEILCGLLSLVLSGVFRQAVSYRDENALTI